MQINVITKFTMLRRVLCSILGAACIIAMSHALPRVMQLCICAAAFPAGLYHTLGEACMYTLLLSSCKPGILQVCIEELKQVLKVMDIEFA